MKTSKWEDRCRKLLNLTEEELQVQELHIWLEEAQIIFLSFPKKGGYYGRA